MKITTDEQKILIFIEKLKPLPAIIKLHESEFQEEVEKRGEKWSSARLASLVFKLNLIGNEAKAIKFENPKLKKAFETIGNNFKRIAATLNEELITTIPELIQQIKFRLQELLTLVTKELTGEAMFKAISALESIGKALGIEKEELYV